MSYIKKQIPVLCFPQNKFLNLFPAYWLFVVLALLYFCYLKIRLATAGFVVPTLTTVNGMKLEISSLKLNLFFYRFGSENNFLIFVLVPLWWGTVLLASLVSEVKRTVQSRGKNGLRCISQLSPNVPAGTYQSALERTQHEKAYHCRPARLYPRRPGIRRRRRVGLRWRGSCPYRRRLRPWNRSRPNVDGLRHGRAADRLPNCRHERHHSGAGCAPAVCGFSGRGAAPQQPEPCGLHGGHPSCRPTGRGQRSHWGALVPLRPGGPDHRGTFAPADSGHRAGTSAGWVGFDGQILILWGILGKGELRFALPHLQNFNYL